MHVYIYEYNFTFTGIYFVNLHVANNQKLNYVKSQSFTPSINIYLNRLFLFIDA